MKKLTFLCAVVALGFGCVANNNDSPIRVAGSFPPKADCTFQTDTEQYGGSFDLASIRPAGALAAPFARYLMAFRIESDLVVPPTTQSTRELADDSRNRVYLNQILLNYRSEPPLSFQQDITDIYAPIDPKQGTSVAFTNLLADIMGTKAAQTLLDNVNPGAQPVTVHVSIQFRGQHASAPTTGSDFFSNKVEFPITVFDSGKVCPAGSKAVANGPCGNPQDSVLTCALADGGTL